MGLRIERQYRGVTISIETTVTSPSAARDDKYRELTKLRDLGDNAFHAGRYGLARELLNAAVRKNVDYGGILWEKPESKLRQMCDRVRKAIEETPDADLSVSEAELRGCFADAQVSGERLREEQRIAEEFNLDLMRYMKGADWEGAKGYIARRIDSLVQEEPHTHPTLLGLKALKDAYLDMWILSGPDPEMFGWVRDNIDDLRWDAVERCINVKQVAGMDIDGFEAVALWRRAIRGSKSGLLLSNHGVREQVFEGILQDINRLYKTDRLIDYIVKNWGKASRESWTRAVPSLGIQTPLKRAGWSIDYECTWLHGRLDNYYRLQNLYDCNKSFRAFAKKHFSEMENDAREQLGLPGVGKGWIAQSLMIQLLEEAFGESRVRAEGSPSWLERQRFDAWIPSKRLAVEYMGQQHYKPVEFFGGAKGFEANQQRDEIKKQKAADNGVVIEYIRYDEDIAARVEEIRGKHKR